MNEKHQKSESERRQLIDISTIGVLFCLILVLYFFAERGVVYPEKVEETAPPDTGKMVVIVIKPEMPEPIESPRSVQKELGKIVQNDQHLKPLLRTIEIDPKQITRANIIPKFPVFIEDNRIYPDTAVQKKPVILHLVKPDYPSLARRAGQEGFVILSLVINKKGDLEQISVYESNPLFDDAAIEAVKKFKFAPAFQDDHPVKVRMNIPFQFTLR